LLLPRIVIANAAYEDEETPRRLGRYELIRRIAVGGMAEIYLARSAGLEGFEKLVVLKKILPQYASTPEFVAMFLDEARLVAGLSHPNIAQVYDIGLDDDGSYFFAMEFVDGEDVRQVLRTNARKRKTTLSIDLAVAITMGIAAGLHAAHERRAPDGKLVGVVHRDISPSNILVTYDGCVKLIDFGIAKAEGRRMVTRTGVLKGKSSYMSPEQTQGGQLDRRSDVFALGILLYELTCGRRPFRGDNEYATMRDIVGKAPDAPTTLVKGYPKDLEEIVLKCLEKDPGKRYQTTLQVQVALEKLARDHHLSVSSVSLAETMRELFAEKLSPPAVVEPGKSPQLQRVLRSLTQSEREAAAARAESAEPAPVPEAANPVRQATITLPGVAAADEAAESAALDAMIGSLAKGTPVGADAPLTLNSVSIQLPRPPTLFSVNDELADTPTVMVERRPLAPMVAAKPVRRVSVRRAIAAAGFLGLLIVAGAAVAGYRSASAPAPVAAPVEPVRVRYQEPAALPAPRVPERIAQDVVPVAIPAPPEVEEPKPKPARKPRPAKPAEDSESESPATPAAAPAPSAPDREAAARVLLRESSAEKTDAAAPAKPEAPAADEPAEAP
jgi:serine/threonine protein kinase